MSSAVIFGVCSNTATVAVETAAIEVCLCFREMWSHHTRQIC
uniref:Uncharacterized protein n=1 Tax=Lotus japonicus TaxID=34305 RepID=I3SR53_LOTJA|nr:unknown [Lotus japonicus]